MATPRTVTLGVHERKGLAVTGAGSTADANVIIEFDQDIPSADVINALERAKEVILEEEY